MFTDLEIMYHRFSHRNLKRHTGILAEELGMSRKDYEDAVKRGMKREADMLKAMSKAKGYEVQMPEPIYKRYEDKLDKLLSTDLEYSNNVLC